MLYLFVLTYVFIPKPIPAFGRHALIFCYGTHPIRKLLLAFRMRSKQTFMLAYLFPIVGTDIQQNAQQSAAVHDWQGPAAHWLR